jgi:8-oxo-dGTP diphosphatase
MGAMRRFGSPVDSRQTYRNRIGAYAVIAREGRLLLTEQDGDPPELQLPGGGIDPGEGALRALHRECLEETGWTIQPIRWLGVYQRYCYMPEYDLWARKVCHIYLCRPGPRHGAPREANHRAVWMPVRAAVAALSIDGDRHFAARVAAG